MSFSVNLIEKVDKTEKSIKRQTYNMYKLFHVDNAKKTLVFFLITHNSHNSASRDWASIKSRINWKKA